MERGKRERGSSGLVPSVVGGGQGGGTLLRCFDDLHVLSLSLFLLLSLSGYLALTHAPRSFFATDEQAEAVSTRPFREPVPESYYFFNIYYTKIESPSSKERKKAIQNFACATNGLFINEYKRKEILCVSCEDSERRCLNKYSG